MIRRLFLEKEIKSKTGVLHFRRWRVLSTPWFGIYIHRIYMPDDDKYLHDHPWNYFSFVIQGCYNEKTTNGAADKLNMLLPGTFTYRTAEQFHKIHSLNTDSVTTLFVTGPRKREWGYKIGKYWVHNDYYRKNKNIEESLNIGYEIDIPGSVRLLQ